MAAETYTVLVANLPALRVAVERVARRAARLGVTPVELRVGEPREVPYLRMLNDEQCGWTWRPWAEQDGALADLECGGRVKYLRFCDVTVSGEIPRLADWEFVATLQHLTAEDGSAVVMLRVVPGHDGQVPERYRVASPEWCDHCRRRIKTRLETFVLRHNDEAARTGDAGGGYAQVGRNCLQDFLGGQDPQRVAAQFDMLLDVCRAASEAQDPGDDGEGDGSRFGGRGVDGTPLRRFLSVVAALVRVDGWTSRGKARTQGDDAYRGAGRISATADDALDYLAPPRGDGKAAAEHRAWTAARPVTDADCAQAEAALEYARGELRERVESGASLSDYEHNLSVACQLAAVSNRLAGIVASLVPHYLREVARRTEREAQARGVADSRHLGTVGERLLLRVRLSRVIVCGEDSQYGPSYLHKMVTTTEPGLDALLLPRAGEAAGGDSVVWFASSKLVVPAPGNGVTSALDHRDAMVEGQEYVLRATVKSHGERDGVRQTVVTRATVLSDADVAKEVEKAARAAKRAAKRTAAGTSPELMTALDALMKM